MPPTSAPPSKGAMPLISRLFGKKQKRIDLDSKTTRIIGELPWIFFYFISRETSYQASRPVDQETSSNFPISKIQASKALSKDLYQQQKLAYLPL
jgi:hypothetical protein